MPSPWPPTPPSRLTLESSRLAIGTGSVVDCFQDVATTEVYGVAAFQAYSSMASLQARITLAKFDKDDRFDLYTAVHGLKLGGKGLSTVTGIVALSRSQISRGIQIYRTNFGFARGPMPMLQVMFLSCIHLIRDIKDDGTVEMLSNVVGAMREMSQSFWIEKQVLKSVAKMLVVHKDDLPTDVQECLWEWEEDKKLGEDETRDDKMWDVERRLAAMQAMMDSMTLEKE
ncbi:hypothetical protein KVT40_007875 [Elsinoe batatas]|uniref:Uncharacterized protein n=1 Tax=Elsinoe batatas TaxID=2601811 RepID=A0A8K0PF20_9PEZI|nr:hypothetical protein KVT40_007875 [Elsinoe batatas]